MTARFFILAALASALAAPVMAQTPDFGSDTSRWANDGECDDPRFQGPGMAQTPLLDSDIMADASDCRSAFNAGTITLINSQGVATTPGKAPPGQAAQPPVPVTAPHPSGINFGDDSSDWANDGECDDRRFVGFGMATVGLTAANTGRDATDCRTLFDAGQIRLWDWTAAQAATQCTAINFGNDSGDYPNDNECDDARFDGPGGAFVLNPQWTGRDATDCSRLCSLGVIALRDY